MEPLKDRSYTRTGFIKEDKEERESEREIRANTLGRGCNIHKGRGHLRYCSVRPVCTNGPYSLVRCQFAGRSIFVGTAA
jgi:hypothetical protein